MKRVGGDGFGFGLESGFGTYDVDWRDGVRSSKFRVQMGMGIETGNYGFCEFRSLKL